nr:hypothetical protein [Methylomarinum sp. Ch1-1]MDP4522300.1 hypothetical protein [Methylomarinum sp. Ch1-1]
MKYSFLTLFVVLFAASGCATNGKQSTQAVQHTGTGTLIIKPIGFNKDAYIREAVKQECNLDGKLAQFIEQYAADQYANIIIDGQASTADAQVMTVEIEQVQGAPAEPGQAPNRW